MKNPEQNMNKQIPPLLKETANLGHSSSVHTFSTSRKSVYCNLNPCVFATQMFLYTALIHCHSKVNCFGSKHFWACIFFLILPVPTGHSCPPAVLNSSFPFFILLTVEKQPSYKPRYNLASNFWIRIQI